VILRPYQQTLDRDIDREWAAGKRNVCAVAPTGGGKTVNMAAKFKQHIDNKWGPAVGIAHRHELVSQMSLSLARHGIRHRIIGSDDVIRNCVRIHMDEIGRSYYDPNALCVVAGVDTLVRRDEPWFKQVTLWQTDETHHLLRDNKWGKAVAMFPNARGIGWTATPLRADGYGLGRHADGVMDAMVVGPSMRELISMGYLTDYRLLCPPSALVAADIPHAANGDFSQPALRKATHEAHITGDIVQTYLKHCRGQLGVTFAVDVEHAQEITQAYRAAGVSAECVTAKTPDTLRFAIMRRFKAREIQQLVNVDLLGEGVDVPAIECVSMGRLTDSYALYAQQFGRALRLLDGKTQATILDHVGNWERHGLPDRDRDWSLDRRERRGAYNVMEGRELLRACTGCTRAFERFRDCCPFCGEPLPEPRGRSEPKMVDGDLVELDPAILKALRGEISRVDGICRIPEGLGGPAARAIHNRHVERQKAQAPLRRAIQLWAGYQRDQGCSDREIHRLFFLTFGTDVMTAQTLGAREAGELAMAVSGDVALTEAA
jgi:DNA repair protein RadD